MTMLSSRRKESVISGISAFTEKLLVSRRCVHSLVEVIKEMNLCELNELEIDMVISRILHVFQSKDVYLKLFCYAFIRAVAGLSSGSFVAINALVNSINAKKDGIRAESLKLLLEITPDQMLDDFSKYVHQSLIETEYKTLNMIVPVLVFIDNPSLEEWFNSVSWMGGLNTSGAFGNAVMLMGKIRPQDSSEIVKSICSSYLKGYSSVVSLRYLVNHMKNSKAAQKKFEQALRLDETDECTFIEAVRSIGKISSTDCSKLVDLAVRGLGTLLSSHSMVTKVAALRSIEGLASTQYKSKLVPLRPEIENMLSKGSTLALLAISILLKIGTDKIADKISKQLPKLLTDMGESQKLSIIDSIGTLCERFNTGSWIDVLKESLISTGSCAYKVKVIQTISKILKASPNEQMKADLESLLCNYVEDSPFPRVTIEILGILQGKHNPQHKMCLMNRMILDNENVFPAIELALSAEHNGKSNLHLLFDKDIPVNENILQDDSNPILHLVKEKLGIDSKVFEVQKKKVSAIESKYNATELSASKKIVLNRTKSEFIISVTKHIFKEFIVLEYLVESQINFVLEEGKLNSYLEDTPIGEKTIYLRGKESTTLLFKLDFVSFEDLCFKDISTTFGYSVNDNKDYEVGEVRLNSFEIHPSDFIATTEEDVLFTPETTETKEFKLSMTKTAVITELKNIFELQVVEENSNEFICKGIFIFSKDLVCIRVKVKESGSKSKAQISICTPNPQLRTLLFRSIA
ncbi:coatomer subunit gamma [Nematocida sp. AWRm80]|nr:coatomer subunit gamma [Nematocida sp. AWRm80]